MEVEINVVKDAELCKKCLHDKVCSQSLKNNVFIQEKINDKTSASCADFDDKTLFDKRPCNIGDRVYTIYNGKVVSGTVTKISIVSLLHDEQNVTENKTSTYCKGIISVQCEDPFYNDGRKTKVNLYVVFCQPRGIERVAYLDKKLAIAELYKTLEINKRIEENDTAINSGV